MHVLVTRPKDDGETLKAELERLGCKVTLEPLIRIVSNDVPATAIDETSTLIITSRNALRALAKSPALTRALTRPVLAVGPGTAALAREMGFTEIFEGPGTGAELVPEITRRSEAGGGPFVYLSADRMAFDVPSALAERGIAIRRVVAYRSVAAETLSPQVADALRDGAINVVVLMSPRTAETWAKIAPVAAKPNDLSDISYVCISEAVANVVKSKLGPQATIVANRPNHEEILVVLKRLAARLEAE